MRCPVCQLDQIIVEYHGVELDVCLERCGVWFDAEELRQLFEVVEAPEALHALEGRLAPLKKRVPRAKDLPNRRCPRCRGKMVHVEAPGQPQAVVLDSCARGHGLWFDAGELEQVLRSKLEDDHGALARIQEFLGDFVGTGDAASNPSGATGD